MKTKMFLTIVIVLILASCGPKPYSETAIGKKKWKYYNKTQYGIHPTTTVKH